VGYTIIYLFFPIKVSFYSEHAIILIEKPEETFNCIPIDNIENQKIWESKLHAILPITDYAKEYLYISYGRKLSKIEFTRISKYFWEYENTFKGNYYFDQRHYENTIFVYKTEKVLCKDDD
jgi:hypothetical protein